MKAATRTMDTRSSMLPLLITSVNEEAESYNGGEDCRRRLQTIWDTLKHDDQLAGDLGRRGVRRTRSCVVVRAGSRVSHADTDERDCGGPRAGPQQAAVGGLTTGLCRTCTDIR